MSPTRSDATDDRYARLELQGGSIVIYDRENPAAWIQSDAAVASGELA